MPEQYVASDKRSGVEVAVTGEFPPHPDDRVRIARTTTLFTRLTSTLLGTSDEGERRAGFRAVETQLELADAMIRRDKDGVRRLVRQTIESMGVTTEQLEDLARQLRELSGMDESAGEEIARALGLDPAAHDAVDDRPDWPPPPEAGAGWDETSPEVRPPEREAEERRRGEDDPETETDAGPPPTLA